MQAFYNVFPEPELENYDEDGNAKPNIALANLTDVRVILEDFNQDDQRAHYFKNPNKVGADQENDDLGGRLL